MMFSPSEMWEALDQNEGKENEPEAVFTNYYMPLLGMVSLVLFLRSGYAGDWGAFNYGLALKTVTLFAVRFFMLPFLVGYVFREAAAYWKMMPSKFITSRLQVFVLYCFSYIMFVSIAQSMLPGIKFVSLVALYLVVIALHGSEKYLRVYDDFILTVTILSTIVICYSPSILSRII